jgi:hypothetical protein
MMSEAERETGCMSATALRREVLRGVGLSGSLLLVSGCIQANDLPAGTLRIRNNQADTRDITIRVTKTSNDSDDRRYDQTPAPDSTPVWTRTDRFTVGPNERLTREGFISETGAFYLEAELDTGESASRWFEFYEAAGGGIAEKVITVDIYEEGHVSISGISE